MLYALEDALTASTARGAAHNARALDRLLLEEQGP
jgi:hypothetical protein